MQKIQNILQRIVKVMEVSIAILLLGAIIIAAIYACRNFGVDVLKGSFQLDVLLESILTLVVGVEFVKMLILQTPQSVIEVLLYAVARQVVISHDSALENLIGVLSVAVIFMIKRTFFLELNEKNKEDSQ